MNRALSHIGMAAAFVMILAVTLGACTHPPSTGGVGSGGAFCDVEEPIRRPLPELLALPRAEQNRIVAHNEHGEAECGWRPNR